MAGRIRNGFWGDLPTPPPSSLASSASAATTKDRSPSSTLEEQIQRIKALAACGVICVDLNSEDPTFQFMKLDFRCSVAISPGYKQSVVRYFSASEAIRGSDFFNYSRKDTFHYFQNPLKAVEILKEKFAHPTLRAMLQATGKAHILVLGHRQLGLMEGDKGFYYGNNELGRELMLVRDGYYTRDLYVATSRSYKWTDYKGEERTSYYNDYAPLVAQFNEHQQRLDAPQRSRSSSSPLDFLVRLLTPKTLPKA